MLYSEGVGGVHSTSSWSSRDAQPLALRVKHDRSLARRAVEGTPFVPPPHASTAKHGLGYTRAAPRTTAGEGHTLPLLPLPSLRIPSPTLRRDWSLVRRARASMRHSNLPHDRDQITPIAGLVLLPITHTTDDLNSSGQTVPSECVSAEAAIVSTWELNPKQTHDQTNASWASCA